MSAKIFCLLTLSICFFAAVSSHELWCYVCEASYGNEKAEEGAQTLEAKLKEDPCFQPQTNRTLLTKCPLGTSCFKQEITILDTLPSGPGNRTQITISVKALTRYCGQKLFSEGCSRKAGPNSHSMLCSCTKDECNSAVGKFSSTSSNLALFAVSTVAAVLAIRR